MIISLVINKFINLGDHSEKIEEVWKYDEKTPLSQIMIDLKMCEPLQKEKDFVTSIRILRQSV